MKARIWIMGIGLIGIGIIIVIIISLVVLVYEYKNPVNYSNITVKGLVLDKETETPVQAAKITITPYIASGPDKRDPWEDIIVYTDPEGVFKASIEEAVEIQVSCAKEGYALYRYGYEKLKNNMVLDKEILLIKNN